MPYGRFAFSTYPKPLTVLIRCGGLGDVSILRRSKCMNCCTSLAVALELVGQMRWRISPRKRHGPARWRTGAEAGTAWG